ncbi:cyclohydrolase [Crepidotus variabilis]|uniref:GTP cyclohydrolase II n=1 Tax=Crepidotus variabilis TaxID=179855 RepID=A0A9P6ESW2_9AGAR|nr:cyclohydrolase [Crepidotus variabilis]
MPSPHSHIDGAADEALLDILTGPDPQVVKKTFVRRDEPLDPLLLAAAAASGPHVTRNHYAHDFFPPIMSPQASGSWDWTKYTGQESASKANGTRLTYVSRQAPRRQRLSVDDAEKENEQPQDIDSLKPTDKTPLMKKRRPSLASSLNSDSKPRQKSSSSTETVPAPVISPNSSPLKVKCMARTRIPTPHGPAFLHIYHSDRDQKEHLAIVVDPAQFSETPNEPAIAPPIRSQSLDSIWSDTETEMERITRGAYVGRLTQHSQHASNPLTPHDHPSDDIPAPLIRIHSECFTGETVGSMRCDCGEQLDEAIRQISQPITIGSGPSRTTIPGRGAVIYLRQEGRGIGLLSKIRAYNLQDMGHDTVTANLMLGHKADERAYDIAGAILRDLGMAGDEEGHLVSEAVRVLTNNPDKVQALEQEGIRVVERVPMIPRSWQKKKAAERKPKLVHMDTQDEVRIVSAATVVGGGDVHGEDLDKYLRTKVLRMGHMLPLWMDDEVQSDI